MKLSFHRSDGLLRLTNYKKAEWFSVFELIKVMEIVKMVSETLNKPIQKENMAHQADQRFTGCSMRNISK